MGTRGLKLETLRQGSYGIPEQVDLLGDTVLLKFTRPLNKLELSGLRQTIEAALRK